MINVKVGDKKPFFEQHGKEIQISIPIYAIAVIIATAVYIAITS